MTPKVNKKTIIIVLLLLNAIILSIIPPSTNLQLLSTKSEYRNTETYTPEGSSASGGGYIMDTNAPFSWIDISNPENLLLPITDEDDSCYDLNITAEDGWNFEFYGTTYENITISTNGWMSFANEGDTEYKLNNIPGTQPENNDSVALFSKDLDPSSGGDIYYNFSGIAPNRYLVIQYYQIVYDNTYELVGNFEVIFYENGTIMFQYLEILDLNLSIYGRGRPVIGLDHGDSANYNQFNEFYEEDLPITSRAISFTFDALIDHTISIKEGDELIWIVDVDHDTLNTYVGTEWETMFGLPEDMEPLDKMKVNITTITDDGTFLKLNYTLWDWIRYNESFTSPLMNEYNYTYFKDPRDYPSDHNLTNYIPLFIPTPGFGYLSSIDLCDEYDDIENEIDYQFQFEWSRKYDDNHRLDADVFYNKMGILMNLELLWFERDSSNVNLWHGKRCYQMHLYNETGIKPNYIEIDEGDNLAYGFYYCSRFFPSELSSTLSDLAQQSILNYTVKFISGMLPFVERTIIIFDDGLQEIYGNLENATSDQILDSYTHVIIPNNTIWNTLCEKLNKDSYSIEYIPLSNGFRVEYSNIFSNMKLEYIYFPNGTLQYLNGYNENGNLFYTLRHNDFDYKIYCPESDDGSNKDKSNKSGISITLIFLSILILGSVATISSLTIYQHKKKVAGKTSKKLREKTLKTKTFEEDFEKSSQKKFIPKKSEEIITKKLKSNKIIEKRKKSAVVPSKPTLEEKLKETKEIEKTKNELNIQEKQDFCQVHRGLLSGVSYICPKCKTKYCLKCARALKEKSEGCWVCFETISLDEDVKEDTEILANGSPNISDLKANIKNKNLLKILSNNHNLEIPGLLSDLNITAISNEFLEKISKIDIDEQEKIEFLEDMLSFTPKERQNIIDKMIELSKPKNNNDNKLS